MIGSDLTPMLKQSHKKGGITNLFTKALTIVFCRDSIFWKSEPFADRQPNEDPKLLPRQNSQLKINADCFLAITETIN
jgi:hypothetical protein